MIIIDGKLIATELCAALKERISKSGLKPGLGVVLVGSDSRSVKYVMSKERAAVEVGMSFKTKLLREDAPLQEIISAVEVLNRDPDIHGIIVQLPLPRPEDTAAVIAAIDPNKDADGMTVTTREHLKSRLLDLIPVVCRVIMRVLDEVLVQSAGKNMVMVVKSVEPYEAFQTLFKGYGAETMRVHPDDPELALKVQTADILVSLPGRPGIITADMVKPGAVVIDYDYPVASVDFERVKEIASAITPVPGGCGPMTVAYLLQNTFELCEKSKHE